MMKTQMKRALQVVGIVCFAMAASAQDVPEMASEPWEKRTSTATPPNPDSALPLVSQGAADSSVYCVPCFINRFAGKLSEHTAAVASQGIRGGGKEGGRDGGR